MKKQSGDTTLTAEQYREIIGMASHVAIEQYQKVVEQAKQNARDKRLHNTKLLMEKYRSFVIHSKTAVHEVVQVKDDFDLDELLEIMGCGTGNKELAVVSVRESVARTRILVHHIDRMLDYFKYRCDHSSKPEDARRYRIIYYSYLTEEAKQKTFQELAEDENVDVSTIYRDHKAALRQLSALIFGYFE